MGDATHVLGDVPSIDHLADRLADFLDYGLNAGRTTLIAEYELLLQAARDPELEPLSRVFYDEIRGQLEEPLRELGAIDAGGVARLIMAALAGLEVDNLADPDDAAAA